MTKLASSRRGPNRVNRLHQENPSIEEKNPNPENETSVLTRSQALTCKVKEDETETLQEHLSHTETNNRYENDWMAPIVEYITKRRLPTDKKKARRIKQQAPTFVMTNGTL